MSNGKSICIALFYNDIGVFTYFYMIVFLYWSACRSGSNTECIVSRSFFEQSTR